LIKPKKIVIQKGIKHSMTLDLSCKEKFRRNAIQIS
jgi:hypothetical protein